eukprot:CAMPEP_0115056266 /NCGR_PEP_ID=MMETSP0227-20121206/5096_1 /TAXON_ID=89957 /ORGANISM="Polarella glacialis, Strain CCMP 1383" /LENGTH=151 /DNA_ID=CAMNT_0002440917 /DNA_START=121 /DNA_END=577 /DNA_ORIENTATION=+
MLSQLQNLLHRRRSRQQDLTPSLFRNAVINVKILVAVGVVGAGALVADSFQMRTCKRAHTATQRGQPSNGGGNLHQHAEGDNKGISQMISLSSARLIDASADPNVKKEFMSLRGHVSAALRWVRKDANAQVEASRQVLVERVKSQFGTGPK